MPPLFPMNDVEEFCLLLLVLQPQESGQVIGGGGRDVPRVKYDISKFVVLSSTSSCHSSLSLTQTLFSTREPLLNWCRKERAFHCLFWWEIEWNLRARRKEPKQLADEDTHTQTDRQTDRQMHHGLVVRRQQRAQHWRLRDGGDRSLRVLRQSVPKLEEGERER